MFDLLVQIALFIGALITIVLWLAIIGSWLCFLIGFFQGKPDSLTLGQLLEDWFGEPKT